MLLLCYPRLLGYTFMTFNMVMFRNKWPLGTIKRSPPRERSTAPDDGLAARARTQAEIVGVGRCGSILPEALHALLDVGQAGEVLCECCRRALVEGDHATSWGFRPTLLLAPTLVEAGPVRLDVDRQ